MGLFNFQVYCVGRFGYYSMWNRVAVAMGDGPTERKNGSDQRSILFVMAMHPHSDVPFLGRVSSLSCPI